MTVRKKFNPIELDNTLDRIAGSLDRRIEVFLIGGLAMIKHGLKGTTKDIDMVFSSPEDIDTFVKSAKKNDFEGLGALDEDYIDLEARMVMEGPKGVRIDVFFQVICGGLEYSASMISRTKSIDYGDRLTVRISSIEDIFLFKAITTRPDDLRDMADLAKGGLDWDVIEKEARTQRDSWKWIARLYGRLLDLKEGFGINSPLIRRLSTEAEINMAIGIIIDKLHENDLSRKEIHTMFSGEEVEFIDGVIQRVLSLDPIQEKNGYFTLIDEEK